MSDTPLFFPEPRPCQRDRMCLATCHECRKLKASLTLDTTRNSPVAPHTFTDAELAARDAAIRSAALAEAVKELQALHEYDKPACCDGHMCGCQGASVFDIVEFAIRAISTTPPGVVCVPVEPSDDEIEACAIAIFDHWQGSGHAHSQTWEDRDKKLPGSTAFFRTIARKGLTASRAILAAHGGKE